MSYLFVCVCVFRQMIMNQRSIIKHDKKLLRLTMPVTFCVEAAGLIFELAATLRGHDWMNRCLCHATKIKLPLVIVDDDVVVVAVATIIVANRTRVTLQIHNNSARLFAVAVLQQPKTKKCTWHYFQRLKICAFTPI